VEVIPGMNGPTRPFGSMHSTNFRASETWKTDGTVAADYGAILMPGQFRTADGRAPGKLPISVLSDGETSGRTLTISGYPADKLLGTQWQDSGLVQSILPARLAYSIDTFGGHSGSPVVTTFNGQLLTLGIHNYGGCPNRCTRITSAVKADLDQWLAESTSP
jgi:glutamyl endopeptidase